MNSRIESVLLFLKTVKTVIDFANENRIDDDDKNTIYFTTFEVVNVVICTKTWL